MVFSSVALRPVVGEEVPVPQRSPGWTMRISRSRAADLASLPARGRGNSHLHGARTKETINGTGRPVPTNTTANRSSLAPTDASREVILENMRLYQRIASLQRTEKTLQNDNRNLSRYMASLQQEDESVQRAWEEEVQEMESAFEAKLKELEQLAAQQKERLREIASSRISSTKQIAPQSPVPPSLGLRQPPMHPDLTTAKLNAWFSTRGNNWYEWADDFAYRDLDRIINLDMIQQHELCSKAKTFVRLTPDGKLPTELMVNRRINASQILLQGLLANFIITETMLSPRWIFAALNVNRAEFVSPESSPVSPVSHRNASFGLSLESTPLSLVEGFPSMRDMDKLQDLFAKAQIDNSEVHKWRSQLMRILTEGGLDHDPVRRATSKNTRRLVRARREYARSLKELFLSGPARLLLGDQDAAGIERLEWRLVNELDMALRLSAQIWSYQTCDLGVRGINELRKEWFDTGEYDGGGGGGGKSGMELCQAQQMEWSIREGDKHEVIAVLRPEIRAVGIGDGGTGELSHHHHDHGGGGGGLDEGLDGIWAKAQVFVSPRSVVAADAVERRGRSRPGSRERRAGGGSFGD
ncbi:hypothetical protein QBC37DRAFT_387932 [Rhypophila decipiens]|uniref:Uncharacterized protein n=1 Tax=Rhypophila decipiens TaxID=261697 RepID=A0AAN6Y914_9PEZI|nr:hypothetical protein QBC37DRAFT_387932 [Rhypophila decipiens]